MYGELAGTGTTEIRPRSPVSTSDAKTGTVRNDNLTGRRRRILPSKQTRVTVLVAQKLLPRSAGPGRVGVLVVKRSKSDVFFFLQIDFVRVNVSTFYG